MTSLPTRILAAFGLTTRPTATAPGGTEFEIDNWAVSEFVVRRLVPVVGVCPYPLNELMLMAGAICRYRPTHVFEWGTNVGVSARVFHETAGRFGIPLHIHSTDLPPEVHHVEQPGSRRGRLIKGKAGISLHLGDGLDTSLAIYNTLPAGSRSLFFVDGDHSYEAVKRELAAILRHVLEPKVLLHDTFFQSAESGYNVGPYLAIRDVLAEMPSERRPRTIEVKTGLPGMTLLY